MLPVPFPYLSSSRSPFRGGAKKRNISDSARSGLENLVALEHLWCLKQNFCSSGHLEQVLYFWETFGQTIGLWHILNPKKWAVCR